jgi:ABC-type branched-subunit amino acid transport system ATPase component
MTLALETQGLMKQFGGLQVTRDLSLRIEQGARHALIGPNGAGKTTVINPDRRAQAQCRAHPIGRKRHHGFAGA